MTASREQWKQWDREIKNEISTPMDANYSDAFGSFVPQTPDLLARIVIRSLAEQIARDLFTNGNGDHAQRLVLSGARLHVQAGASEHHARASTVRHFGNGDLGGWCESAATDRIEAALLRALLRGECA